MKQAISPRVLPILTSTAPFLSIFFATVVIIAVLSLLNITSIIYIGLAFVAGVSLALSVLVILANIYARKTGTYLVLASYTRGFRYLPTRKIIAYGISPATGKGILLFGLVEFATQVICVGLMLFIVIQLTPTGYF